MNLNLAELGLDLGDLGPKPAPRVFFMFIFYILSLFPRRDANKTHARTHTLTHTGLDRASFDTSVACARPGEVDLLLDELFGGHRSDAPRVLSLAKSLSLSLSWVCACESPRTSPQVGHSLAGLHSPAHVAA